MAATIKDVARMTGLSIATISKYLNGGNVLETNRTRIDQAVRTLGFKANAMARGLKTSRTMTVGVLIPDLENVFCTSIVSGVENLLQAQGYGAIICDYRQQTELERRKLVFLADRQIDGLLMMPLGGCADLLEELLAARVPVVLIDRPVRGLACDTVLVDNLNASYGAVERLIVEGHRRIGILTGPEGIHTAEERLNGYLRVHGDYGLEPDRSLIRSGGYTTEGGYRETLALLDLPHPPTALFVTNYEMTLGAVMALNERKVSIPGTLSFIGFDSMALTRILTPSPSIVVQPIQAISETAARLLIRRMQGDAAGFPAMHRMKTELIVTESIAPPPAS